MVATRSFRSYHQIIKLLVYRCVIPKIFTAKIPSAICIVWFTCQNIAIKICFHEDDFYVKLMLMNEQCAPALSRSPIRTWCIIVEGIFSNVLMVYTAIKTAQSSLCEALLCWPAGLLTAAIHCRSSFTHFPAVRLLCVLLFHFIELWKCLLEFWHFISN